MTQELMTFNSTKAAFINDYNGVIAFDELKKAATITSLESRADTSLNIFHTYLNHMSGNKTKYPNSHVVKTPMELCEEIVLNVLTEPGFNGTTFLVLYTIEFYIALIKYGVLPENITFYSPTDDDKYKHIIVKKVFGSHLVNSLDIGDDMKFDVVLGNPPFNGDKNKIEGTRAKQLFADFAQKALLMSDNVCLVLPSLWTHKKNNLKNSLIKFGLVSISSSTKYFDISFPTCYVIAKRGFSGKTRVVNELGQEYYVDLLQDTNIYLNANTNSSTILNKLQSDNNLGTLWNRSDVYNNDTSIGSGTTSIVSIIDTKTQNIEMTTTTKLATDFPCFNEWKVITNLNLGRSEIGVVKVVGPNIGTSYSVIAFPTKNSIEAANLKNYLESKIVSFVFSQTKNTVSKNKNIFERIPLISLTKSWTDAELYQHFGLTDDEIAYIESEVQ